MFQGAVSIFISSFSFRIPFPFSNISTHLLSRPLDLLSSEVLDHPLRPLWAPPSHLKCYDDDDDEDDDEEEVDVVLVLIDVAEDADDDEDVLPELPNWRSPPHSIPF